MTKKRKLEKMNIMQKKAVRMITFNDTYPIQGYGLCHSLPIFLKLEFLKISDIYKTQISNFIYDCLNGYAPFQFISWFNLNTTIHDHHTTTTITNNLNTTIHDHHTTTTITNNLNTTIHDHHTRSNVQLQTNNVINTNNPFIPFARTTHYGKNSIKVVGPKIWNEIPDNIRAIKSKKGFLYKLKQYYIAKYNCTN